MIDPIVVITLLRMSFSNFKEQRIKPDNYDRILGFFHKIWTGLDNLDMYILSVTKISVVLKICPSVYHWSYSWFPVSHRLLRKTVLNILAGNDVILSGYSFWVHIG